MKCQMGSEERTHKEAGVPQQDVVVLDFRLHAWHAAASLPTGPSFLGGESNVVFVDGQDLPLSLAAAGASRSESKLHQLPVPQPPPEPPRKDLARQAARTALPFSQQTRSKLHTEMQ